MLRWKSSLNTYCNYEVIRYKQKTHHNYTKIHSRLDLSPPGILPKMPKTSVFGLPRCHFTFALHRDQFEKNWWVETYPNTIKLSKYAIKTVFKNDRSIRNFGNIPKTEGKSARWVSQAFFFVLRIKLKNWVKIRPMFHM